MENRTERQLTPEEVLFDARRSGLRRVLKSQGRLHAVILASDLDGEMHLELSSNGDMNMKTGGDTDGNYGKVDLETAIHMYAYITNSDYRRIETTNLESGNYAEAMNVHIAENREMYTAGLLGAMGDTLNRGV